MISVVRSRGAQSRGGARDLPGGQSLSRYLEEVSKIPLLTREQEVQVAGELTEAREQLLLEYASIPEAVVEMCRWARRAAAGEVCFDRYFDFMDSAPTGRRLSCFLRIVRAIERDLERLVKAIRLRSAKLQASLEQSIGKGILALCPTEPIIAKAEEVVRDLVARGKVNGNGNGNGHGNGHGGNGNGHGGNGHGRASHGRASADERLRRSLQRIDAARRRFEESRRILTESNLRLAIAVAKHYRNRGVPLGDLIQEGNLGLIRACDRFDARKGYRFSTYAVYWIRQSITRALPEQARTVRVPPHLTELLSRFFEARTRLTSLHGREPSEDEVAELLGVAHDKLARAQALPLEALSLDRPLGEDGSVLAWDLPDTRPLSPILHIQRRELEAATAGLPALLSPREAQVIEMRFGLCGRREMTLEEIGRRFSVTRERIRQIQAEALRKLRVSELVQVGDYARAGHGESDGLRAASGGAVPMGAG